MKSLAIVGATGVVGRCVLKVLEEENLPIDNYFLFATKKSKGKILKFKGKDFIVKELDENSFRDYKIDFAIFSAGSEMAKKFAPIAANSGTLVIDNSNAFRMDKNVPLVVPEVNSDEIKNNKGIIANPNCSTIQAVLPLKVLNDLYGIKRVVYSTYQAVSGAGRNGIEDLKNGIIDYYNSNIDELKNNSENINTVKRNDYKLSKFEYQIFNNVLPHIDIFMDNGYTKEEVKMINETRKILKMPNLNVTATCARVPIFNSHAESINVELERDFSINRIKEEFNKFKGIKLVDDVSKNIYPLSTIANGTNDVYVGRIRRDYSIPYGINMWVVADNIRKGAATNAVQILKKLL